MTTASFSATYVRVLYKQKKHPDRTALRLREALTKRQHRVRWPTRSDGNEKRRISLNYPGNIRKTYLSGLSYGSPILYL